MGDLKVGEGFIDAIVIRRTSDRAHGTGLSPVCTVMKLSDGTIVTPTVAELTLAVYKVTDWSPAADTEYLTLWELEVAGYTIYSAFKLFKVGGGRTEDIFNNLVDILDDVTGLNGDGMRGTNDAALAASWTAALATALAAYTAARGAYLDELDFALQEAIAAIPTTMVGTDGAALASSWTAALATALGNYTAGRAVYLDQLDFNLQEAIAAIPTTMVGTNNAALASSWTAALATALGAYTAARGAYLDQLDFNLQEAIAAIPTTMVGTNGAALAASWTAALATALGSYTVVRAGYLDQLDFNLQEAIAALGSGAGWPVDPDTYSAAYNVEIAHSTNEQTVATIAETGCYAIEWIFDVQALIAAVEGGVLTLKLKNKADGVNSRIIREWEFVIGESLGMPGIENITVNHNSELTLQLSSAVTAQRACYSRVIITEKEGF